jgi:hypothetical protein
MSSAGCFNGLIANQRAVRSVTQAGCVGVQKVQRRYLVERDVDSIAATSSPRTRAIVKSFFNVATIGNHNIGGV